MEYLPNISLTERATVALFDMAAVVHMVKPTKAMIFEDYLPKHLLPFMESQLTPICERVDAVIIMRTVNKLILMIIYSQVIEDLAPPTIAIVFAIFDYYFYNMKLKFTLNMFMLQICIVFLILYLL